jgi:D-methionine transport system substrate-binding protein
MSFGSLVKSIIFWILLVNHAYAIKVGVTAGPHAFIMQEVKKLGEKTGLEIEIVEFNDFVLPNSALAAGDIDANSYQHKPFLEQQIKDRGYNLVSVSETILLPIGLYSKSYENMNRVEKSKIAIPNDPTNGSRALILLQGAGLIKLSNNSNPTILDISDNPLNLQILEVDAPQIPRILEDVDYGIVNTDWILQAGMDPKSALLIESVESNPYTNVIVVRSEDVDKAEIRKLIELYRSVEIRNFIEKRFNGTVTLAN